MSDRDSDTTTSSLSVFQERDVPQDDENDEIVFFGDDSESAALVSPSNSDSLDDDGHLHFDGHEGVEIDDDDDFEDFPKTGSAHNPFRRGSSFNSEHELSDEEDRAPGYSEAELAQTVQVVQSSKDKATGRFLREEKQVRWCLANGCEQVEPGIWSKAWYFTYLHGEDGGHRAWSDAVNRRLVKQRGGKAFKLDDDKFCEMLQVRAKGNRSFSRGQYKAALDCYLRAETIMGGAVSGMYLVPHQRAELVKVLSNQAECYLRMNKYQQSILQSTAALQLDKKHEKSLLRRAKAMVHGAEQYQVLDHNIAAQASDDLRILVSIKGEGAKEAQIFLDQLDSKVQRSAAASKVRQQ